ncbi:MAG TPA: hypothetical protein RMH99_02460 [Sandaracinaceae bacterium LLY-WYZ-13_1]|nr:hypothetical protein [Sandaracinaceae bacterium LLY-WYZ-13_1]
MSADAQPATLRLWRLHEVLGVLPAGWALFHLWEQWPAFLGRAPLVARLGDTSHGPLALTFEIALGLAPALGWIGLEAYLRRGGEPLDLAGAMAEDEEAARRLGLLARAASWIFFGWLVYHAAWLWLPKLVEGSDPTRTWLRLRDGLGLWAHAIPHAIGLTAFVVHLWAAGPRLAVVLGAMATPSTRRAVRLSSLVIAVGLGLLYAQLAGWHAAGAGTVWPMG